MLVFQGNSDSPALALYPLTLALFWKGGKCGNLSKTNEAARLCLRPLCSFILPNQSHAERHEDVVVRIFRYSSCRSNGICALLSTPPLFRLQVDFRSGMLVLLARRLYGEFWNQKTPM